MIDLFLCCLSLQAYWSSLLLLLNSCMEPHMTGLICPSVKFRAVIAMSILYTFTTSASTQ